MKIVKVLSIENHNEWARVWVRLDDGLEGYVWVGGEVNTELHNGQIKVYIKRNKAT